MHMSCSCVLPVPKIARSRVQEIPGTSLPPQSSIKNEFTSKGYISCSQEARPILFFYSNAEEVNKLEFAKCR